MLLIFAIIISLIMFLFELVLKTHKTYGMNRLVRKYVFRTFLAEFILLGGGLSDHFLNIVRAGGPEINHAFENIAFGAPNIVACIGFIIDYFYEEIDLELVPRQNIDSVRIPIAWMILLLFSIFSVAQGIYLIKTGFYE